jgi:cytochrome c551/c552
MEGKTLLQKTIWSALGSAAAFAFVLSAMLMLGSPNAQATPAIAKGKPCGTCHTGSPPSKSNVKK